MIVIVVVSVGRHIFPLGKNKISFVEILFSAVKALT